MMGFGLGFGFIGLLVMLLFWVGLIAGGAWLVKVIFSNTNQGQPPPGNNSSANARAILDQRYARGEISREEYELIKQDLR